MCQMSVVYEKNGTTKTVMENVTFLEAEGDDIRVSTLFEEPKVIAAAYVKKIDFMGGKVTLAPLGEKNV
ncbi:MAG: CooT family nickel-binding protein [Proteobacteria bacterium]|nr:CooT family nickel-binding protein [Pseudomonadota bacterium]MBU0967244.1 CooT family nickel-binding protein [Pseudomonadota bacterium]